MKVLKGGVEAVLKKVSELDRRAAKEKSTLLSLGKDIRGGGVECLKGGINEISGGSPVRNG